MVAYRQLTCIDALLGTIPVNTIRQYHIVRSNPGASMRVMAVGFLMFCAAIHSSACWLNSRPRSSSCHSAPIRRLATAAYNFMSA